MMLSKSMNIPDGILYCEGRKALNKETKKPILNEGKQFYWCKNKPCYQNEINIKRRETQNKRSWTIIIKKEDIWDDERLYQILKRIDKNYTEEEHSYNLGIINKFFNYLKHLKCKSCNSWLTPIIQSNFAYDRVNHFKCEKDGCVNNGKEIYISHCLNYRCNNTIDSRVSKQCFHGWYICDYCFSCCSTEKLLVRKEIRTKNNQGYDGPEKGHDELEKIFCYECGNGLSIKEKTTDSDRINEIFDSFYAVTGLRTTTRGEKKSGKKWILITLEPYSTIQELYSKIKPLEADGIIINESESGNGYFINAPVSDSFHYLTCPNENCKFTLYLESVYKNDKEKFYALKYHKEIDLLFRE